MDVARQAVSQRLIQTLEELTKLYRQLLDLVRKEKDLLIGAQLEELTNSNTQKETLIQKVRLADALRMKCAEEYGAVLGLKTETPRLLELAQKAGGPDGERLRTLHGTLDLLIRRLAELNRENESYTRSALKTLNGAMNDIKDTLSGKKTYERKGHYKRGPEQTGNFVSKEA